MSSFFIIYFFVNYVLIFLKGDSLVILKAMYVYVRDNFSENSEIWVEMSDFLTQGGVSLGLAGIDCASARLM